MSDRKLSLNPLRPNGTPRKITISLDPALAEELDLYATAYAAEYGWVAEMDALLIPIIRTFLNAIDFFRNGSGSNKALSVVKRVGRARLLPRQSLRRPTLPHQPRNRCCSPLCPCQPHVE